MSSNKIKKTKKLSALQTDDNAKNSLAVLEEFFAYVTLQQAQEKLWNWMEVTVTGGFNKELTRRERCNTLFFYRQLLSLLEAVDAIYKSGDRNTNYHSRTQQL